MKAAGISKRVTFHASRHTYATMLLTLGVDIYTVSKLLGHTKIETTQIYAKIINKKKDDAVSLIDGIFNNLK
jgi:site-specific recombinase XerD